MIWDLGVREVLAEERARGRDVAVVEQAHEGGVRLGLVVRVAPDPVDLRERQLELVHQAVGHVHEALAAGQPDQGDVEGQVALVECWYDAPSRTAEV